MQTISLEIAEPILAEAEKIYGSGTYTGINSYINEALMYYNGKMNKRMALAQRIKRDSQKAAASSYEVMKEFEAIEL